MFVGLQDELALRYRHDRDRWLDVAAADERGRAPRLDRVGQDRADAAGEPARPVRPGLRR